MKKNIFMFILSILFFVCCFTALAHAQSDDVDMVCLDGKKDTVLTEEWSFWVQISESDDTYDTTLVVGEPLQLQVIKYPKNSLLDTVIWSNPASEYFDLTYDGILTPKKVGYSSQSNPSRNLLRDEVFATTSLTNLESGVEGDIKVYVSYTYNGHIPEYVELAGEKWATSNVGADSPEEVGKYFMYGDIVGYTREEFVAGNPLYDAGGYNMTNYENSLCGNGHSLPQSTSYRPGDCEFDAATVNKGYHYVTPTADQLSNLINSDDVELVCIDGDWYRYERSDQKGLVIKKKGTNPTDGQFIFLPENRQCDGLGFTEQYVNKAINLCEWHMIQLLSSSKINHNGKYLRIDIWSDMEFDNFPGKIFGKYPEDIYMWDPEPDQNPDVRNVKKITDYGGWYGKPIRPIYRECNQPFSVSATKYVEFSTGNAQYNSNSSTWRFAPTQYSIIGNASSDGWTDLHYWNADFSSLGSEWYMLSNTEWNYLLSGRANASALHSAATVYGVPGLIILPDTWVWPNAIDESKRWETGHANTSSCSFSSDWNEMQEAGAIFLPIAIVNNKGYQNGMYWTPTKNGNDKAYYLQIPVKDNAYQMKNDGKINEAKCSIRLVKDL